MNTKRKDSPSGKEKRKQHHGSKKTVVRRMGFEPTPFRMRALISRLRPLGHLLQLETQGSLFPFSIAPTRQATTTTQGRQQETKHGMTQVSWQKERHLQNFQEFVSKIYSILAMFVIIAHNPQLVIHGRYWYDYRE